METFTTLGKFFGDTFSELDCDVKTRAYIVSIFAKYTSSTYDLSDDSITLTFFRARQNQDFLTYQTLGDWIFFAKVEFPEHLRHASEDYYTTVAQMSYYSCYRLINRQWKLFEELADRLDELENEARYLLTQSNVPIPLLSRR